MHKGTIVAEGKRTGLIDRKVKNKRWLLKACLKDPGLADQLAASRLVYLIECYRSERIAVFEWVVGEKWKTKKADYFKALEYYEGVVQLRSQIFYGGK
jgi:hypothetical protein